MFFFVCWEVGGRSFLKVCFFQPLSKKICVKLIENVQVFQDEQRQLKDRCFNMVADTAYSLDVCTFDISLAQLEHYQ